MNLLQNFEEGTIALYLMGVYERGLTVSELMKMKLKLSLHIHPELYGGD